MFKFNLDEISNEELEDELRLRKEKKNKRPELLPMSIIESNLPKLIKTCEYYLDEINNGKAEPDDHYIFEAALDGCYGKDIWNWINNR
jgi:hypothetical protein